MNAQDFIKGSSGGFVNLQDVNQGLINPYNAEVSKMQATKMTEGDVWGGAAQSAVSMAGSGMAAGFMVGGPMGAGVGAAIGAIGGLTLGLITGNSEQDKQEEVLKQAKEAQHQQDLANSLIRQQRTDANMQKIEAWQAKNADNNLFNYQTALKNQYA